MVAILKNIVRAQGVLIRFDPDPHRGRGQVKEHVRKTMCCQHCGKQVILPKDGEIADVGDLCRNCFEFICPTCVQLGSCHPLEQYLVECERTGKALNPYRLRE